MPNYTNPKKNQEGYADPTAFLAVSRTESERKRVSKLVETITSLCDFAGFDISGRVVLVNKRTGKVWK